MSAFNSLLSQGELGSFVVIEHPVMEKFVQFALCDSGGLLLDLPAQVLSEREFYNALRAFQGTNVVGSEFGVFDRPDGIEVARQYSFNATFSAADEAVSVVKLIFEKVFEISFNDELVVSLS
ncbi:hypothetical protein [Schlesneria paludicola]|uniref:hypothetical protein n=1 Tax=Schlesneria paludicola TaxID=360056 RepID=UPI0004923A29|nr:hypothetical protein [Schlesneria paludicola]